MAKLNKQKAKFTSKAKRINSDGYRNYGTHTIRDHLKIKKYSQKKKVENSNKKWFGYRN